MLHSDYTVLPLEAHDERSLFLEHAWMGLSKSGPQFDFYMPTDLSNSASKAFAW